MSTKTSKPKTPARKRSTSPAAGAPKETPFADLSAKEQAALETFLELRRAGWTQVRHTPGHLAQPEVGAQEIASRQACTKGCQTEPVGSPLQEGRKLIEEQQQILADAFGCLHARLKPVLSDRPTEKDLGGVWPALEAGSSDQTNWLRGLAVWMYQLNSAVSDFTSRIEI